MKRLSHYSLHSRLKEMMKHFNGVSTKYLYRVCTSGDEGEL